jgi:hypothetical protein
MTPLAELSPIDPTTANQFNPREPTNQLASLGIAVEDVTSYQEFWKQALDFNNKKNDLTTLQKYQLLQPLISRLVTEIHALALGNVQRVYMQMRVLARMLLQYHYGADEKTISKIIDSLTKGYYSHHHMINRHEAKVILGKQHIEFADATLTAALDSLRPWFRGYPDGTSGR